MRRLGSCSLSHPTRPVGLLGTPEQNGFEKEGSQTGLSIRTMRVFELWGLYCYICSRQQNHHTKQPDNQPRLLGDQASRSKTMWQGPAGMAWQHVATPKKSKETNYERNMRLQNFALARRVKTVSAWGTSSARVRVRSCVMRPGL